MDIFIVKMPIPLWFRRIPRKLLSFVNSNRKNKKVTGHLKLRKIIIECQNESFKA